jgi:hypothetical protein
MTNRFTSPTGVTILTRRDIEEMYPAMKNAHDFISSKDPDKPMADKKDNKYLTAAEIGLGAVGIGLLSGRLGTTQIGQSGIPLGVVIGAIGWGVAGFNLAGRFSDDVRNLSTGAALGWATLWAAGQGSQMRARAGQPAGIIAGEAVPPQLPYSPPPQMGPAQPTQNYQNARPLTEAELQVMAQNQRY